MTVLELVARLGLAVATGLAIGLERQLTQHDAGMRTHVLVALGAALFTISGAYGFGDLDRSPNIDPARVAAQVASGVGFIGAGAIIRLGASIRGLTSAATLWLTGALGVAAGAGARAATVAATIMVLITLVGLRVLRPSVAAISRYAATLEVEYERGQGTLGPILESLEKHSLRLEQLKIQDDEEASLRRVVLTVTGRRPTQLDTLTGQIGARKEVKHVELRRQYDDFE